MKNRFLLIPALLSLPFAAMAQDGNPLPTPTPAPETAPAGTEAPAADVPAASPTPAPETNTAPAPEATPAPDSAPTDADLLPDPADVDLNAPPPPGDTQSLDAAPPSDLPNPDSLIPGDADETVPPPPPTIKENKFDIERKLKVRYQEVKLLALKDRAIRSLREQADAAKTDEGKRQALREYYRLLFAKMISIDDSLKEKCDTMEQAYLRRLGQYRVEPAIPLNPPPTPAPLDAEATPTPKPRKHGN